jgi:hypothetical protein
MTSDGVTIGVILTERRDFFTLCEPWVLSSLYRLYFASQSLISTQTLWRCSAKRGK